MTIQKSLVQCPKVCQQLHPCIKKISRYSLTEQHVHTFIWFFSPRTYRATLCNPCTEEWTMSPRLSKLPLWCGLSGDNSFLSRKLPILVNAANITSLLLLNMNSCNGKMMKRMGEKQILEAANNQPYHLSNTYHMSYGKINSKLSKIIFNF